MCELFREMKKMKTKMNKRIKIGEHDLEGFLIPPRTIKYRLVDDSTICGIEEAARMGESYAGDKSNSRRVKKKAIRSKLDIIR